MTTHQEATEAALTWAATATAHLQAAIRDRAQAENLAGMVGAARDRDQFIRQAEIRTAAHHEARQTALMWAEVARLLPLGGEALGHHFRVSAEAAIAAMKTLEDQD